MRPFHVHIFRPEPFTPPKKTIFVYGHHILEAPLIEKNKQILAASGIHIHKVPRGEQVFSDPSKDARRGYHDFLEKKYPGHKVVDLHTSPAGFRGAMPFHFRKKIVGLEISSGTIGQEEAMRLKQFSRESFRKKIVHGDY